VVDQHVSRRTILVVEDNPVEQQVVSLLVTRFGFVPEVVPTGYKALEKVASGDYAAVLMNYVLPVMDGPECAERIRQMETAKPGRMPIIAVTARAVDGTRERCLQAGMDDYLSKPYSMDQFKEIIERWVPVEVGS
jgi:CheY-like chemotaxis protein